jgi:nucleotide-binding universal stress UspA family protein
MFRSILVPLDGSDFGETALPLAIGLARHSGARLHLLHVRPELPPLWSALPQRDTPLRESADRSARQYLGRVCDDVSNEINESVSFDLVDGPVPEAIADYAGRHGIDLIVMTTHGRGGLQRAWLGSVASDLIRRSTPPLLLIRPSTRGRRARPRVPRSVLVPLDGSAESESVLPHALELAGVRDATVTLLHIIEPIFLLGDEGLGLTPVALEAGATADRIERGRTYLAGVADRLAAEGHAVRTEVLNDVDPPGAILRYAGEHGSDVIAMSTHGRSGLARLAAGSVSDKVVRGGRLPVLLSRLPASAAS